MTSFLPIVDGQDTPQKRNINIEYEKSYMFKIGTATPGG